VRVLVATCLLVLVVGSRFAHAHGEIESTEPAADATVSKIPKRVSITFTETPSKDGVLKVVDGCRKRVVDRLVLNGTTMSAVVTSSARPGRWKVSYDIISAEDGHPTSGSFIFKVAGKRDCNAAQASPSPSSDTEIAPNTGLISPGPGDDGGGFPVVPVAIGAGVLVLGALAVRIFSGGPSS
jgi:copper resistance protein C